jgi:hypothetical protein
MSSVTGSLGEGICFRLYSGLVAIPSHPRMDDSVVPLIWRPDMPFHANHTALYYRQVVSEGNSSCWVLLSKAAVNTLVRMLLVSLGHYDLIQPRQNLVGKGKVQFGSCPPIRFFLVLGLACHNFSLSH